MKCSCCRQSVPTGIKLPNGLEPPALTASTKARKEYTPYTYKELKKPREFIRILVLQGNGSEDAEVECRLQEFEFKKENPEYKYEALSWCWGISGHTATIIIREMTKNNLDSVRLSKKATPDLVAALRALRYQDKDRYLWIDQICIDQNNKLEKNHQVEMMAEIYGRASKVCIWLGERDRASHMALQFIEHEVLQLQNFDELCESPEASEKWEALLELMQRPWFSRRWVVQEVALARDAVIYCGEDEITWKKFAVAVELFVEVETATHRLSEVMKNDPRNYHVPGWFEYVSELGASLLVEATGKLFRDYKPNGPIGSDHDKDDEFIEADDEEYEDTLIEGSDMTGGASSLEAATSPSTKKDSQRQPLLTLEYLVSSLSIFELTIPHDAVYALLAIARDTTPTAYDDDDTRIHLGMTQDALEVFTQKKRYVVDYRQPFANVCKEFVAFCIERSKDRTRALDIICRPWAPNHVGSMLRSRKRSKQGYKTKPHDGADGSQQVPAKTPALDNTMNNGSLAFGQNEQQSKATAAPDVPLSSWISALSGAAHAMYPKAGVHTLRMGRKNADTLVGLPASGQSLDRNYNAAETKGVDMKSLKFLQRPGQKWSMFVKGFVLDKVSELYPSSQGGAIPQSWAQAGGWCNAPNSDPPDSFWRTLVADRGRDGRNPPVYYSRACRESFAKGGLSSGSVNTADLIHNERCSVVAQFCRRVQAVIWNRSLIRTGSRKLGLARQEVKSKDFICILYGCSVPVVLRRVRKTREEVLNEVEDDLKIIWQRLTMWLRTWKEKRRSRLKARKDDLNAHRSWDREMLQHWRECSKELGASEASMSNQDELLERRAYESWKNYKHKIALERKKAQGYYNAEDPVDKSSKEDRQSFPSVGTGWTELALKRQDKVRFELGVRYFRRWKHNARDKRVLLEQAIRERINQDRVANFNPKQEREVTVPVDPIREKFSLEGSAVESTGKKNVAPDIITHKVKGPVDDISELPNKRDAREESPANESFNNTSAVGGAVQEGIIHNGTATRLTAGIYSTLGTTAQESRHENASEEELIQERVVSSSRLQDQTIESNPNGENLAQQYRDWLLEAYTTNGSASDLVEPDWALVDKKTLEDDERKNQHRILSKWHRYEFLGECYVHGMMDGEAMAYQNRESIPAMVFELR